MQRIQRGLASPADNVTTQGVSDWLFRHLDVCYQLSVFQDVHQLIRRTNISPASPVVNPWAFYVQSNKENASAPESTVTTKKHSSYIDSDLASILSDDFLDYIDGDESIDLDMIFDGESVAEPVFHPEPFETISGVVAQRFPHVDKYGTDLTCHETLTEIEAVVNDVDLTCREDLELALEDVDVSYQGAFRTILNTNIEMYQV